VRKPLHELAGSETIVADRKLLATGRNRDIQLGLADIDADRKLLRHLPLSFGQASRPSLRRDTGSLGPRDCAGSDLAFRSAATLLDDSLYGLEGQRSATPQPQLFATLGATRQDTRDQRGAIFLPPEQSPILSFSACLAENPGSLPALPHPAHKSRHGGFIYSISAIFCTWQKKIGILREARVE
jgi:hypothetical protein